MRPLTITLTLIAVLSVTGCQSTAKSFRSFFEVDNTRSERQVPEGTFVAQAPQAPLPTASQQQATLSSPPPPMSGPVDLRTAPEKSAANDMEVTERLISTPAPIAPTEDNFFPFKTAAATSEKSGAALPVAKVTEEGEIIRLPNTSAKAETKAVPVAKATPAVSATPPAMRMVYFDKGSSALNRMNRELVKENVSWLLANPNYAVIVEGHTDAGGSEEHNEKVGAERAKLVADYMMHLGLDAARIEAVSYGESRPLDDSGTRAAEAKNRRVQFLVYQIATDAASAPADESGSLITADPASNAQIVFGQ